MTIEEIYKTEDISVRSYNICVDNGLTDLTSILKHYRDYKTFDNLRNCGSRSNRELTEIYLKYKNYENGKITEPSKSTTELTTIISNLNRYQREIVNDFIEINYSNLSNRSKNAISLFLDGNIKVRNISEKILTNARFDFKNIKNIGSKSVIELKKYFDYVTEFTLKVSEFNNESDLIPLRNRYFIEKSFPITSIPDEILESQSIFSLVDFLIKNNIIYSKNDSVIFQKALNIYNDQTEITLDNIAEELNLTRERIRQIRNRIVDDLLNKLQFIKIINDDLHQKYGIDHNQNIIIIDHDSNKHINELNNTNFSAVFNNYLLYACLSNKFDIVGETEDVLLINNNYSKDRHNWKNIYLVKNYFSKEFDFNNFANDVDKRINSRNEETYSFNFKSYLNNFITNNNSSLIPILFPIAEKIINQEFNIIIDLDDNIVFNRNTIKQVNEYAIEALETLGKPSKVEEIFNQIIKSGNNITKSQDSLRGSLQKTPEIIHFGRSSTYGLKKWEIEKEGIKGGTIKDIVIDYLQDKAEPIHVYEILNEVHKYREKTNAKNILTNLKLDPQKQFIIFNQSFIGLSSKTYNSNLISLPKFLGKTITYHISKHKLANRATIEEYFSKLLEISNKNMCFIIDNLIEQKFVIIDDQKKLCV